MEGLVEEIRELKHLALHRENIIARNDSAWNHCFRYIQDAVDSEPHSFVQVQSLLYWSERIFVPGQIYSRILQQETVSHREVEFLEFAFRSVRTLNRWGGAAFLEFFVTRELHESDYLSKIFLDQLHTFLCGEYRAQHRDFVLEHGFNFEDFGISPDLKLVALPTHWVDEALYCLQSRPVQLPWFKADIIAFQAQARRLSVIQTIKSLRRRRTKEQHLQDLIIHFLFGDGNMIIQNLLDINIYTHRFCIHRCTCDRFCKTGSAPLRALFPCVPAHAVRTPRFTFQFA